MDKPDFTKSIKKEEKILVLEEILLSVKKELELKDHTKDCILEVTDEILTFLYNYDQDLDKGLVEEASKRVAKKLGGKSIMKELASFKDTEKKRQLSVLEKTFSSLKKDLKNESKEYVMETTGMILTYFYDYNPSLDKKLVEQASKKVTKKLGGEDIMEELDFTIAGALQRGIQKGRKEERQNIILKMLKNKVNVQTIIKYTGTLKKEVLEIQKQANL